MNVKIEYSEKDRGFVASCDKEGYEFVGAHGPTEEAALNRFCMAFRAVTSVIDEEEDEDE